MWNPELVYWGDRGRGRVGEMLGKHRGHGKKGRPTEDEAARRTINYWAIHAVYALHYENELVYIGEGVLGDRIKMHFYDETDVGRWDRFSWLSPVALRDNGTASPVLEAWRNEMAYSLTAKGLVELLELVAITLAQPIANRQQPMDEERITWVDQVRHDQAERSLHEQIAALKAMLEEIKGQLPKQ